MQIGSEVIKLASVSSTNSYAAAILQGEMVKEGTVILADYQTAGRGQQGNLWESVPGKNLLFSIILYPAQIKPADQFTVSMVVSLGIASVLKENLTDISIKWPNDIYSGDDKIAGLLIENSIVGETLVHSIAGIGLNVNQVVFTGNAPNPVSMKIKTGHDHDRELLLGKILKSIEYYYLLLNNHGNVQLRDDYKKLMYRFGKWHRFRAGGYTFRGLIAGVDNPGCLLVKREDGTYSTFAFKEIEYL